MINLSEKFTQLVRRMLTTSKSVLSVEIDGKKYKLILIRDYGLDDD
jgi:hypothetical protein